MARIGTSSSAGSARSRAATSQPSMPGIYSWEVATRLCADPALEEVPLLATTAYNVSSTTLAAQHAGCQQVVAKPFDLHDISRRITAFMLPHTRLAPHYA